MGGYFISIEGIDGAGKSSIVDRLKLWFLFRGVPESFIVTTREPGGTPVAEKIRAILKDPSTGELDLATELMLFEAARASVVNSVIRPALDAGKIVIADRYIDSTKAYQAYGRGMPTVDVEFATAIATDGLEPDITFLVDISIATSFRRRGFRLADRTEMNDRAFYSAVREGYRLIAELAHHRIITIDGEPSIEAVVDDIADHLAGCVGVGAAVACTRGIAS